MPHASTQMYLTDIMRGRSHVQKNTHDIIIFGLPSWPANAGVLRGSGSRPKRLGFHPWVGKIPWRRHDNPPLLFLENPVGREAWRAAVHRVT